MNIVINIDDDVSSADKMYLIGKAIDNVKRARKSDRPEISGTLELEGKTRGYWILSCYGE